MKTITMEHSKYAIEYPADQPYLYRVIRNGKDDITAGVSNNVLLDLILEIDKLKEENERLKGLVTTTVDNTPFMTSPIGDLPVNAEGMRKAIDTIAELKTAHNDIFEILRRTQQLGIQTKG